MKKSFALALLCLGFVVLSCEEDSLDLGDVVVSSLKVVGGDTIDVYVGDTAYINVEYSPDDALAPKLYWYGYNQLLLKAYEKENMIIGRKRGTTVLNVGIHQSDVSTSCVINILPVTFSLSYTDRYIYVADTFFIKPILPPEVAKNIRWESSNPRVATISRDGMISALSAGECEISAVAYVNSDTLCSNKCRLTVQDVDMTSLVLSDTLRELVIEESFKLKATFEPVNTTFTDIIWNSSDTCVAIVDASGNVKGVGLGACIISAFNKDTTQIAQCNVVVGFREMSEISLLVRDKEALHYDQFSIEAVVKPVNATMYNKALRWKSSDDTVAKVDEFTGLVTCVEPGECFITAYNIYNSVSDSCHLVVNPLLVSDIEIDDKVELLLKNEKRLSCTVRPTNATDSRVKWESSDDAVVTIDSDGNVKATGVGSATITVTALDAGGCTAQSTVTVKTILMEKIEFPEIKDGLVQLVLDSVETQKISYKITPDETIDKEVEWKSSDESVVTVDAEGNIACVGNLGEAKITVSALDGGGCENSFDVKVVDKPWLAEDYVNNSISITFKDSIIFTIKGEAYTIYTFEVYNKGKENTIVERVSPVNDSSTNLINEVYAIEAKKKKEISLEAKDVVWTFIHNGYVCIKEE